jgi:hypothetical protein
MKVGDLVKFVGVANYYMGSMGIVTKTYNTHGIKKNGQLYSNSAIVYMPERPEGRSLQRYGTPCFHPLCLTEIEVIS